MMVFKALCIALSMYSKIPVPQVDWTEKNMKYAICFFPVVGIFIAFAEIFICYICKKYNFSNIFTTCMLIVTPLLLTGGIHVDGFIDTTDALKSYQSKEKKLEILKDAHIGAFAVIMLMVYYIAYFGAMYEIDKSNEKVVIIFSMGFIISRILSAVSVVSFKSAKKDGILYAFSSKSHKIVVKTVLSVEFIIISISMYIVMQVISLYVIALSLFIFAFYRYKSYKEFGGITGDLAGYFLSLCEIGIIFLVAILTKVV